MSQIIEKLEKIRRECWTDEGFPWDRVETKKILPAIDQALTLLKQQPPAGEFTKEARKVSSNIKEETDKANCLYICTYLDEACDRLDRAEALNKDILPALQKIKKEQKIDPFYLDTLIAIVKNAIAEQTISPVEGKTDNPDPPPIAKAKKE